MTKGERRSLGSNAIFNSKHGQEGIYTKRSAPQKGA